MKKFVTAAVTVVMAASGIAFASPAAALENPVDITTITVPAKVVVASTACRNVAVTYTVSTDANWELSSAEIDVARNGLVRSTEFIISSGLNPYFYCPTLDGLGKFTFGPSAVNGNTLDFSDFQTFADSTSKSTQIKVQSKVSATATRSGSKVTFTAKSTRFYLGRDAFGAWSAPKATLQKKKADGTWAAVATMPWTSTGTAKKTITASRSATYRVVTTGNSFVWGATSKTVTK